MTFEIIFSEQSENDLRGIYEYIAFDLQSPVYAARQYERLETEIMKLNQMPERFERYKIEPWHSRGLRLLPVDNYCVLYIPDMEKLIVYIVRIMYSGRDIDTQLNINTEIP